MLYVGIQTHALKLCFRTYKINAVFLCGYIYYPYICSVERNKVLTIKIKRV